MEEWKKYDGCVLFEESEFVYPVFRCPTFNITTKFPGTNINNYPDIKLTEGLCPSEDDPDVLDPDRTDCNQFQVKPIWSQCANNCPGGKVF